MAHQVPQPARRTRHRRPTSYGADARPGEEKRSEDTALAAGGVDRPLPHPLGALKSSLLAPTAATLALPLNPEDAEHARIRAANKFASQSAAQPASAEASRPRQTHPEQ